jgi:hypothetical protein
VTADDRGLPPDAADIDVGPPVHELASLTEVPGRGFFERIRRSVERRKLSSQMTEMSLTGIVTVFLEFLGALFGMIAEVGATGQGDDER